MEGSYGLYRPQDMFLGRRLEEWAEIGDVLLLWGIRDAEHLNNLLKTVPRAPGDWSGY